MLYNKKLYELFIDTFITVVIKTDRMVGSSA